MLAYFKYTKDGISRKLYHYRLTQDQAGHVGRGRKFAPSLESNEGQLATKDVVGNAQSGTTGLDLTRLSLSVKERRKELVGLMKKDTESKRLVELGKYEIQAKWLAVGIDNMWRKDLTWNKLLYQCSDRLVKFLVNAIPNWLPSPDMMRIWKQKGDHKCGLCGSRSAILVHILCGCPRVLQVENKSGNTHRDTWRHNCILEILAKGIQTKIQQIKPKYVLKNNYYPFKVFSPNLFIMEHLLAS